VGANGRRTRPEALLDMAHIFVKIDAWAALVVCHLLLVEEAVRRGIEPSGGSELSGVLATLVRAEDGGAHVVVAMICRSLAQRGEDVVFGLFHEGLRRPGLRGCDGRLLGEKNI